MRKSILARTALVATIATVTGAGVALPAAAATSTSHYTVQAQLDNNPGSGAGWVWVYSGSDSNGRVDYQFYDGSIRSLHTGWWTANSTDPGHPVAQTAMLGAVEMPAQDWDGGRVVGLVGVFRASTGSAI
ncbi:hypothetical protein SAMN05444920_109113 [Nonomuraea solani]|uniref:Uncharacterized protein n=1 Tax=Nonomuraea solani TaxID=1144553 RepID=A0A1H6EEC1_9ACTN|nr:hypothetical protein [Nonomuraea solani]SEG95611.1 hypothetical protein SAMN05444920_109113 [Nonomuraea solani]